MFLNLAGLVVSLLALQTNDVAINKVADFEISGDGSNAVWSHANWISMDQQLAAGQKAKTDVKMLYSETGIYFLYRCEDTAITSTFTEDFSNLWEEDVVEFFIWTDQRHSIYFEYELSPKDVELVLLVPNIDSKFLGWIPWNYEGDRKVQHATKVQRNAQGDMESWTAEIFLPFALLEPLGNVPPAKDTKWFMNFYRIDYDSGMSTWAWKPVKGTFHQPDKFGSVIFK